MKRFIRYLCAAIAFTTFSGVALNAVAQACPERDVRVIKQVQGAPAGYVSPSFAFTLSCGGTPAVAPTFSITDGSNFIVPARTVGAVCTLTETLPAPPAGFTWTSATSSTFTVGICPNVRSFQTQTFVNTLAPAPLLPTPSVGVPSLSSAALWALVLLLGGLGWAAMERRR